MPLAIEAHELSKRYRIGQMQAAYGTLRDSLVRATAQLTGRERPPERQEIWALRDVSFHVQEGEVLGVIGRNGAGKSTLLKILTRITTPTSGRAVIRGRVGSLLEVGTGFNPELTGRENVFLNGSILGMKRREIQRKLGDIVEFSGIDKFIDTPVKRYSSGMHVRLAFSVAAHQVVTHYLHSTSYASGAHISWPDDETAPGDDLVRLLAVRAIDEDDNTTDAVDARDPIGIEIRYRVLRPGPGVFTKIRVRDRRSDIAFNAMDVASHAEDSSEPGLYTATAWISGNLLNEGTTTVDVAVCTLRSPKLHQRAARYEAVLFTVFDPGDGDSARGRFTGQISGVVRPRLEWSVERVG